MLQIQREITTAKLNKIFYGHHRMHSTLNCSAEPWDKNVALWRQLTHFCSWHLLRSTCNYFSNIDCGCKFVFIRFKISLLYSSYFQCMARTFLFTCIVIINKYSCQRVVIADAPSFVFLFFHLTDCLWISDMFVTQSKVCVLQYFDDWFIQSDKQWIPNNFMSERF